MSPSTKGYLLPEFYSGATGLTGRFNEGFLLRRLHPDMGSRSRVAGRLQETDPRPVPKAIDENPISAPRQLHLDGLLTPAKHLDAVGT